MPLRPDGVEQRSTGSRYALELSLFTLGLTSVWPFEVALFRASQSWNPCARWLFRARARNRARVSPLDDEHEHHPPRRIEHEQDKKPIAQLQKFGLGFEAARVSLPDVPEGLAPSRWLSRSVGNENESDEINRAEVALWVSPFGCRLTCVPDGTLRLRQAVIHQPPSRLGDISPARLAMGRRFADRRGAIGASKRHSGTASRLPQSVDLASHRPRRIVFAHLRLGLNLALSDEFQHLRAHQRTTLSALSIFVKPLCHRSHPSRDKINSIQSPTG